MDVRKSNRGRKRQNPTPNGPFNDLIHEAMRREGIKSLDDWADKHLIGRTTTRSLYWGRQSEAGTWIKPELGTLVKLGKALGVPLLYLLERIYADLGEEVYLMPQAPVVGWVGAGPGQLEEIKERFLPLDPDSFRRGEFEGYKVRGNSMCAGDKPICDGDFILINKLNKGRPGSRVVAKLKDGGYVCKILKVDSTGKFLVSANPAVENGYPAIIPSAEVVEIIGKVVEVRKTEDGGS